MILINLARPKLVLPPRYRPFRVLTALLVVLVSSTSFADSVWFDISGSVTSVLRRDDGKEISEVFPFQYGWCADATATSFPRTGEELAEAYRSLAESDFSTHTFEIVTFVEEHEAVSSGRPCATPGTRRVRSVEIEKVCRCLGNPELPLVETAPIKTREAVMSETLTRRVLEMNTADCSNRCVAEGHPSALAVVASVTARSSSRRPDLR